MNFLKYIKEGIKIIGLKKSSIKKIANDKKATNSGIIILLIAGLLSVVGLYGVEGYVQALFMAPLFTLVFFVLGTGMLNVFVRLFGGKNNYPELFRPLSHAAVMCWLWLLLMIPILGPILNWIVLMWGIVISIVAIQTINPHMSKFRAVMSVIVPFLIALIVVWIVGQLAMANLA
jgi:hypothetical protein